MRDLCVIVFSFCLDILRFHVTSPSFVCISLLIPKQCPSMEYAVAQIPPSSERIQLIKGNKNRTQIIISVNMGAYILSIYSPFSDRFGLPLYNILSSFLLVMDISVELKFWVPTISAYPWWNRQATSDACKSRSP